MAVKLDAYVRNMGPQSTAAILLACARAAEAAGLDAIWVADHIAIPPDDAEGSGGRYLDPLATLAFLAGATERIELGTGVLVLPYRPALATAKWVATIQELSGERLLLGVGVGWMDAEFRVVGVARRDAAAVTDATLAFLQRCFANDEMEANGQRFLFRPRPSRPPILVGGAPPHAFRRVARFADGWMPIAKEPATLGVDVARLRDVMAAAGKPAPEVVVLTALPLADPAAAAARARAFVEAGATRLVHSSRYEDADAFRRDVDVLATHVVPALVG